MRGVIALVVALGLVALGAPPPARAEAQVTITPSSGPYGTVFEQRATGLPPGIGVVSVIRDPTGTEHSGPGLGVVPPSGEWRIGSSDTWRAERGEPLGEYTAMIKTIDGTTTLATATFTVTEASAQATGAQAPATLPRAGEAGSRAPLFASLGITLVSLGFGLRRWSEYPSRR